MTHTLNSPDPNTAVTDSVALIWLIYSCFKQNKTIPVSNVREQVTT